MHNPAPGSDSDLLTLEMNWVTTEATILIALVFTQLLKQYVFIENRFHRIADRSEPCLSTGRQ